MRKIKLPNINFLSPKYNASFFKVLLQLIFNLIKSILLLPFKLLTLCLEKVSNLFRFSISFKINFVYILIFISILIPFSLIINFSLKFFMASEIESNLNNVKTQIFRTMPNQTKLNFADLNNDLSNQKIYFAIYDSNNLEIYSSINDKTLLAEANLDIKAQIFSNKSPYISKTYKAYINNTQFNLLIIKDISLIRSYLRLFVFFLYVLIFKIIIIASLIGSRVSKHMLKPIKKMTETVNEISINNLSTRLDIKGSKDELKDLAITFNSMVDNIQMSYEKQNQFVSDASHELRTPISVIQGYINLLDRWGKEDESILEEAILAIKEESQSMKDLVEKLLYLARMDKSKYKLEKDYFSINELIDEIFKETKMIDENHDISCSIDYIGSLFADRNSIKQVIRILVDNSIKFTQTNGSISINLKSSESYIIIDIIDNGVGIPQNDIPYIFNRFYRSDKSRTKSQGGNGLGLSIAKWILEQHNALIEVTSKLDHGTKISIAFPKN